METEENSQEFNFFGIGTSWCIVVSGEILGDDTKEAILGYVKIFEKQFSRFLPDSETNSFRNADAGDYQISREFSVLLNKADHLRTLTKGVYDPAVGGLLERAGYDASYRMEPTTHIEEFILPKWSVKDETLILSGPTAFDFGGIGKGYCIDQVAGILKSFGYEYFLVDGGGDMFGTTKSDGVPWKIAIEYPGKPDVVAGLVSLENQGIAVSDSFRRRWGKWHHIVNPQLKETIELVVGAVAVTSNAWDADCTTSALFLSESDRYPVISEFYQAQYLVFQNDGLTRVSPSWKGELF